MSRLDLTKIRDASGNLCALLGKLGEVLTRTYPNVSCRGSQHEEDEILRELLPGAGTYVDIGAGEPVECSNTWAFYERGWRGLLVEPLFYFWPSLLHQRPGDLLYDSAIRNYTGVSLLRIQGTVSSVLRTWNIAEQCELFVPCETAAEVLARFPAIRDKCRFCSIDVEGVEKEVLETIDWSAFQPEVLCIEYRTYDPVKSGEDISAEWVDILVSQGYQEVARTGINIIFQKET